MKTSRGRAGAAVTLVLTAVLTGCGGNGSQGDGFGEGTEPSSTGTPWKASGGGEPTETKQPSSSVSVAVHDDGSDVEACFDGRCEIALSKPTAIEVDSRFGVPGLRVTKITADSVVLESSGAGTFMETSLADGTTGVQNGLGFRLKSLDGGTAVLEFFPS